MAKPTKDKPNIIFILADDLGYGDLSCYGADKVETPNIDKIAEEGKKFTDAHSPSSVCSPSRYNFLTGQYCWRTWCETGCIWANDPLLIDRDQTTVASLLKEEDYFTGLIGKWHLGFGSPGREDWDDILGPDFNNKLKPGPLEVGFDYFYGLPAIGQEPNVFIENHEVDGLDPDNPIKLLRDPREEFLVEYDERPRTYNIKLGMEGGDEAKYDFEEGAVVLTNEVVDFIEDHQDERFFLYYATRNIHAPIKPHPSFKGTSDCGIYGDFIHELDWSVGEIMNKLNKLGLDENTLVIFTSDNGAVSRGHKPTQHVDNEGHKANGLLKGQKTQVWEGGHRVPFIVKWPGTVEPGTTSDEMIALTDMLATFYAIFDKELPEEAGPDSFNILPAILDKKQDQKPLRKSLVNDSWKGLFSIRKGPWKLITGPGGGGLGWEDEKENLPEEKGQLYNLDEDLGEENNLYDEYPEKVEKLTNLFENIKTNGS